MANQQVSLKQLTLYLGETFQPDRQRRVAAEKQLESCDNQPGFPLLTLSLLNDNTVDIGLRQAAAILFKNLVKRSWFEETVITTDDRALIKNNIVNLMLTAPEKIQKQLAEALTIISKHDFPAKWDTLLPDLITKMRNPDVNITIGVLRICHSILKRYRHMYKADQIMLELKYVLELFQQPLLGLFTDVNKLVHDPSTPPDNLKFVFTAILLMSKLFYSLCSIDLPEFFEDHLSEWMTEFHKLLQYETQNKTLLPTSDEEPGLLLKVQASICRNVNLFISKYEEEFANFYPTFVTNVWNLLNKAGKEQKFDQLVGSAMTFLTSASKSVHYKLFESDDVLNKICINIIIPNMCLRESDEETFEMNAIEYIRQDMEGSDSDTRRRAACELVKGLRKNFEAKVTEICSTFLHKMLQDFVVNPKDNWKSKDAAIYLVIALSVKGVTVAHGSTGVNELFPVLPFFTSHILPELNEKSSHPVLQADALKFITIFRSLIGPVSQVFPYFIKLLAVENQVVHSYAANAIERYLTIKDTTNGASQLRYGKDQIKPFLEPLLVGLFKVFDFAESRENEYVMKAVMRVISAAQQDIIPVYSVCIEKLLALLATVYKNPTKPLFNHYLFEAIAAVIKNLSLVQVDPAIFNGLETKLFQAFKVILDEQVVEFEPYIFQILSQILELNPTPTISSTYVQIFPALLVPNLWLRKPNVPALVRLLSAYIRKASTSIVAGNHIEGVLGVFQKLISSSATEHEGFLLLEAVFTYVSLTDIDKFMSTVLSLIFRRLSTHKTPRFIRSFLVFLSLTIGKHGADLCVRKIDALQPELFKMVLSSLLFPYLPKVLGVIERKMSSIAVTKLLTESDSMMSPSYAPLWPELLKTQLALFESPQGETQEDTLQQVNEFPDDADDESFGHQFSTLYHSTKLSLDPFADIQDHKTFFARSLQKRSLSLPGKLSPIIQSTLSVDQQQALKNILAQSNLTPPFL